MIDTELITITNYLQSADSNIHKEHLTEIRAVYRKILKLSDDDFLPEVVDDVAIRDTACQLNLQIDTNKSFDFLRDCVSYADIDDAITVISAALNGEEISNAESIFETFAFPLSSPLTEHITKDSLNVRQNITIVTDIDCTLNIIRRNIDVERFIESFLLQDPKMLYQKPTSTGPPLISKSFGKQFCLTNGCLLDLFIRCALQKHDVLKSNICRLIEPISSTDDFGTWSYDHWHGIFDLELKPHHPNCQFPSQWRLDNAARIHCTINNQNSVEKTSPSKLSDRPRTASLDVFIQDVCALEKNHQEKDWLSALHKEDIFTYEHLENLQQSEWERIRLLSMNAKKTLKAAIDRKRENVARDQDRRITNDSDAKIKNEIMHKGKTKPCDSELLANIHLIKLFIRYILREERVLRHHGTLPILEAECLELAFKEMQEDGFADDDNLFERMKNFFLPLTISEEELCIKFELDIQKRQTLIKQMEQLNSDIKNKLAEYDGQNREYKTLDESITKLEKCLKDSQNKYERERPKMIARNNSEQKRAEDLNQLSTTWHRNHEQLTRKLNETKKLKDELSNTIDTLNDEIKGYEAELENVKTELSASTTYVDKKLVKPPRGLLMFGPPGTGKSDIMSKLAVKLGIVMVGPPLAAGELNRPLVGESERILIALCQRCNRIPYAMCCVSIDEIDSLAPKRNEDSSEGKIDKISVLLSLIEGIKDIPNLMILCATNRLHMMDEAFLRRMSGKFFVGRPSSKARTKILQSMPACALNPGTIKCLSIATTNFSGAAVRALTRAITVEYIATRRSGKDNYQIGDVKALELANITAQQYQIFFGNDTLPRLRLRNLSKHYVPHSYQLPVANYYTGRIIVDLHNQYVKIELRVQEYASTTDNQLPIIMYKLNRNETNVQSLLQRLADYGHSRNVQLLQLVDLNLLASQSAHDEKKVFETLKDRYDECIAYSRSMIVYDLDALVGVNKSESNSNMGISTSSSIVNQNIYTYIRARFRDCTVDDDRNQFNEKIERWAIAVVREPFLLRQFSNDVQFKRTREEEDEIEFERRQAEDLVKCVKCKDFYIENENRMGSCVHHDGFIYDNSATDLQIYAQSKALLLLNKLESDIINNGDQREELERQKTKFKWICCDAVLVCGSTGGCKKGKHGFKIKGSDNLEQQRLTTNTSDRLDEDLIQKWEEECRANEEYNDKWLKLLGFDSNRP